jgi:acyl-CoA synthetase (AMP-forming)/AMP-acid ligase II
VLEDAPVLANTTIKRFLLESSEASQEIQPVNPLSGGGNAIYESFVQYAMAHPSQDAVVQAEFRGEGGLYSPTSYADLLGMVNKYQRGLAELGLVKGDTVLFLVPVGLEFLALAYAVMGRGAVPVFVDPGVGRENLRRCISDAEPDVLITVPKGHLPRLLWRRAFRRLKFHLTVVEGGILKPTGGSTLSFLKKYSSAPVEPVDNVESCMIACTSGATGTPKGVVFTSKMAARQMEIFRDVLGLSPGGRDVPLLPIFSIFNVAYGVTAVFPPLDAAKPLDLDAMRVVRMMQDLKVTTSFGSPTLWAKIADYCVRAGVKLPSVRRVFMAGAPVPDDVILRVNELLPEGEVVVPYGATEALPVSLVVGRERVASVEVPARTGEKGGLVGTLCPGVEARIIEPVSGPIATMHDARLLGALEIGEIIVRGPNVSTSYHNRPDANRNGKIADPEGVWHRIGDVGYFDHEGRLYFCGRKAHVVRAAERTYFSIPVERIFNRHEKVRRSALVGLEGGTPAVVVEPLPQYFPKSEDEVSRFTEELRAIGKSEPLTEPLQTFFFHPSFPVDGRHNAKIFRDKLGEWASAQRAR